MSKRIPLLVCALALVLASALAANAGPNEFQEHAPNEALWWSVLVLNPDGVDSAFRRGANANSPRPKEAIIPSLSQTPLDAVCDGLSKDDDGTNVRGLVYRHYSDYATKRELVSDNPVWELHKKFAAEIARTLIANGSKWTRSNLECLTSVGAFELVELLLAHGVKPTNWRVGIASGGYTDTEFAKLYGQGEIYRLLVAHGGDPVDTQTAKQLAITEAASWSDIDSMARALSNGAQLNAKDPSGRTPLCAAAVDPDEPYVVETYLAVWWLLDKGANTHASDCGELQSHDPIEELVQYAKTSKSPEQQFLVRETLKRAKGQANEVH